jgi:hypothetical protein
MKKVLITLVAVLICAGTVAFAANPDTKTVAVSATVSATAKLVLSGNTLTFPDRDPDTFTTIAATEGTITITAKGKTAKDATLTLVVKAPNLTTSGSDTIAVSAIKWTATGTGYSAGTMATTDVGLGSWTNSGDYGGTQTYALDNSWSYATGAYSTTITYTLTAL